MTAILRLVSNVALVMILAGSALAQSQTDADRAKRDEDLRRISEIGKNAGGKGQDARCTACPQACELVCDAGNAKCIAELRQERERMFENCRKRK